MVDMRCSLLPWFGTKDAWHLSAIPADGSAAWSHLPWCRRGQPEHSSPGRSCSRLGCPRIAVHIAARILGQAGAGEILVSRTVRDLVVGSGTGFEDRGSVELRGVPGTWQLLAVDRLGP